MPKKLICVDMGWTIEDESAGQLDRVRLIGDVCRRRGLDFDPDAFLAKMEAAGRNGVAATFRAALDACAFPAELRAEIAAAVLWRTDRLALYPGVREALAALAARHSLVVLANQSKPVTARLEAYGIAGYFDAVVCSCEVGFDKPDPRIFRLASDRFPGREPWMVGDRIDNDVVPAKRLGWRTIRVLQGDHRNYRPRSADEEPDFTVASFAAAAEILL
jgi:HAD superfamily hydrolase (TIGR01509 family)